MILKFGELRVLLGDAAGKYQEKTLDEGQLPLASRGGLIWLCK